MHFSAFVLALPLVAALPRAQSSSGLAPVANSIDYVKTKRWEYKQGDDRYRLTEKDVESRRKQGWQDFQITQQDPAWTRERLDNLGKESAQSSDQLSNRLGSQDPVSEPPRQDGNRGEAGNEKTNDPTRRPQSAVESVERPAAGNENTRPQSAVPSVERPAVTDHTPPGPSAQLDDDRPTNEETTSSQTAKSRQGDSGPRGSDSSAPKEYASAILKLNGFRNTHHVADVTWDATLANKALSWANRCFDEHFAEGESQGTENGQVLWASGYDPRTDQTELPSMDPDKDYLLDAISSWYSEKEVYERGSNDYTVEPRNYGAWGHFAQLVWKSSTSVGCAVNSCSPLKYSGGIESSPAAFAVCYFDPPLGSGGSALENVLKP